MSRLPLKLLLALAVLLVPAQLFAEDDHDDRFDEGIAEAISRADPSRIAATIERLQAFGTRNSCSTNIPDAGPQRGVNAARDWIAAQFKAISPRLQVRLDSFPHAGCEANVPSFLVPVPPETKPVAWNVVAWLPGKKNPNRLVIIGGHYDSRTFLLYDVSSNAPGANDSGAQSAVVLEVARLLVGSGEQEGDDDDPPTYDNTLVFVTFSGEEQGLVGSAALAGSLRYRGVLLPPNLGRYFDNFQVIAMLNNDITGGDKSVNGLTELRQFRLYSAGTPRERFSTTPDGTTDNTSPSRGLMRYIRTWGAAYVPEMQMIPKLREDRPGRGSDQSSFVAVGAPPPANQPQPRIPAVRFMETVECSPSPADNSCGTTPLPCPPVANIPDVCKSFTSAHQHTQYDLADSVTPSYTTRIAQVMAATMASLARAPGAPQIVEVVGDAVRGARVRWTASAYGRTHAFVIAARPTTQNFYRKRVRVSGQETSRFVTMRELGITPGQSFFISVAAEDARGHESLFAYPEFRCDSSGCAVPPGALDTTASAP